jgi:hypothetical protein
VPGSWAAEVVHGLCGFPLATLWYRWQTGRILELDDYHIHGPVVECDATATQLLEAVLNSYGSEVLEVRVARIAPHWLHWVQSQGFHWNEAKDCWVKCLAGDDQSESHAESRPPD